MNDGQIIEVNLSSLFGGELIEIMYNNYKIKMRICYDEKIVSINFYKNNYKIHNIYKKFIMDAYGELSNLIENSEQDAIPILNDLWSKLIK